MLDSDSSVSSPITVLSFSCKFCIFRLVSFTDLQALAKWPFLPQLLHVCASAGHLCIGFQFGALKNLHGLLLSNLLFGFVANLSFLDRFFFYLFFFSWISVLPVLCVCCCSFVSVLFHHFDRFFSFRFFSLSIIFLGVVVP